MLSKLHSTPEARIHYQKLIRVQNDKVRAKVKNPLYDSKNQQKADHPKQ